MPSVRFEAVPGLEEGSNRIIRDVLSDKITGVKCSEICEQLLSIEGVGSSLAEWIDQIKENLAQGFTELQDVRRQMNDCEHSLQRLKDEVTGPDLLPPEHVQSAVVELGESIARCVRRASGFSALADEATTTAETYSATELIAKADELRAEVTRIEEQADTIRKSAEDLTKGFARTTSQKVAVKARALAARARDIGKKVVPIRRRAEGNPTFQIASDARKSAGELLDELYIAKDELTELNNMIAQAERDLETQAAGSSSEDSSEGVGLPSTYQSLVLADNAIKQSTEQITSVRDLLATHLATHLNQNTALAASKASRTLSLIEDLHSRALEEAANAVKARVKADPEAAEQADRALSALGTKLKEAETAHAELKDILAAGLDAAAAAPNLPETTASPLHKAEGDAGRADELLEAIRSALAKGSTDARNAQTSGRLQRNASDAERMVGKADGRLSDANREAQAILADLRRALKQRDATALAMHRERSRLWGQQIAEMGEAVDAASSAFDSAKGACEANSHDAGLSLLKAVEARKDSLRKRFTEIRALEKALATQAVAEIDERREGLPAWIKVAAVILLLGGIGTGVSLYLRHRNAVTAGGGQEEEVVSSTQTSTGTTGTETKPPTSDEIVVEISRTSIPPDSRLRLQPSGGGKAVEIAGESHGGNLSFKTKRALLSPGARISLSAPGYAALENIPFKLTDETRLPLKVALERLAGTVRLTGPSGQAPNRREAGFASHFYSEIVFTWLEPLPSEGSVKPESEIALDIDEALKSGARLPTGKYEVRLRRPRSAASLTSTIDTGSYNRAGNRPAAWNKETVGFSADDRLLGTITVSGASGSTGSPSADSVVLPTPPPPVLIGFSSIEDNVTGGISIIPSTIILRFPRLEILALAPDGDWNKSFAYEENIGATLQAVFASLQETAKTIPQPPAGADRTLIDQHLGQLATALGTATSARKALPSTEDQLHSLLQMLEAYYHASAVGEIVAEITNAPEDPNAIRVSSAFYKETLEQARASFSKNKNALAANNLPEKSGSVLFAGHELLPYFEASIPQADKWYEGMDQTAIAQFGALHPIFLAEAIVLQRTLAIQATPSDPARLGNVSMDFRKVLPPNGDKPDPFTAPNQVGILQDQSGYFREYPMFPEEIDSKGNLTFAVPYATQGQPDSFSIIIQSFGLSESRGEWTLGKQIPSRPDSYSPLVTPSTYIQK